MNVSKQFNFLWIVIFSLFQNTYAAGDLTRQNPIEIKIDMRSSVESHFFSPSLIRLETSKLYKIVLKKVLMLNIILALQNFRKLCLHERCRF